MACAVAATVVGCSSSPEPFPHQRRYAPIATIGEDVVAPATQRSDLLTLNKFSLYATPPEGWVMKDHNADPRAEHVVWVSPTGDTAFGAIFFRLPWPIGHDLTLRLGVLPEARRREGSAELVERYWDPRIEGLRFVIRTPRFTVETKLFVRGLRGWAAYSGTMTTRPVNEAEASAARRAREDADFGEEIAPPKTPVEKSAADERG